MSKKMLMMAFAAAALTACTSEDVVVPDDPTTGTNVPIAFSAGKSNMSRTATYSNLETVCYDFGVWAYKTKDDANKWVPVEANKVMGKYLVGYYTADPLAGYKPNNASQDLYGSNWYYEKLGSSDNGFTFTPGVQLTASTSTNTNQYLKYWDLSFKYVNFFACAPYGAATAFDPSTRTMTFTSLSTPGEKLYGATAFLSSDGKSGNKVGIQFKRLTSEMRMAFYSEIEGYYVDLIDYNTSPNDGILWLPANYDAGTSTYSAPSDGQGYIGEGTEPVIPKVTWNDSGDATVSYTGTTISTANIQWPLSSFSEVRLGTTNATKICSDVKSVLAHGTHTNCGFTVNVSFKLTAKDTNEVIYVYGARVYVGPSYTAWENNKLYTYVFKVTKEVTGTTSGPVDPSITPTTGALYPIIFDNLQVEDLTEVTYIDNETPFTF